MSGVFLSKGLFPSDFFQPTVDFILNCQQDDGSIPWFEGSYADPWDHTEAAMALSIGGEWDAAAKAYQWLADNQLDDGSWWAAYKAGEIDNGERRESNFVAYIATGVWHHYLISHNKNFLKRMWPTVERAIEFVLSLQSEHGDIQWAVKPNGSPKMDALITGCSSIYKSLECAINIAVTMGEDSAEWVAARESLGDALRNKPERFDRTWESKARYSMDWFYPVLTGVLSKTQSQARLKERWDEFVEPELGCRCVSDEPWVTIAESCELTMALLAAGDHARAVNVYSWLHQWRLEDGSYWTGYQFVQDVLWPDEKPTWTAGAILLAADALTEYTPAAKLFTEVNLLSEGKSVPTSSTLIK
ncbi:prenyltransferase/squalene oxidase repeat-containing protein [Oceanicoccus sagamiensis]|uniref:Prenyltransferase n=1 Tax=Oceanicoccus sagamiensis TaxID=716816 RepID=A0A1X9ND74_9GAMM|nr:prenyltransferase/squalene oxidase repeat-containing protein [Oceanicoccus sagamiensis]ARN73855.1 prenyltransferase [Oceanicoccus sagamiensis]